MMYRLSIGKTAGLIAIFALCLTSCSKPQEKPAGPVVIAKPTNPHEEEDWLFDKKLKCSALRPTIEKAYQGAKDTFIGELFYSPKLNTCVFVETIFVRETKTWVSTIFDALTSETLFMLNSSGELERHLSELKAPVVVNPTDPLGIR